MHPHITVVSLGPGPSEYLTLAACHALQKGDPIILRTRFHGAADWLNGQQIPYTTLDPLYETAEDFSTLNQQCAEELWRRAATAPIIYGVMESWSDSTVAALYQQQPAEGTIRMIPGMSTMDSVMAAVPNINSAAGIRLVPATDLGQAHQDPSVTWIITEIDTMILAGQVKLWLMELYPDEMTVSFLPPAHNKDRQPISLPLFEVDQQPAYDHSCALVVPPVPYMERSKFCFHDMQEIMEELLGPYGDTWLKQQTHQSVRGLFLEEAYEVVDALDAGDTDHLCEELGDIMLHVALQSHLGKAHGEFTMTDVLEQVCRKMIHRHPQVFLRDKVPPEEMPTWEELKKEEKHYSTIGDSLLDISPTLPSLPRAAKVQYKAGAAGFDWSCAADAFPKILEEAHEVEEELAKGGDPSEELGDLLFSCVNVIRLCGLDPELVLSNAVKKFTNRFIFMEKIVLSEKKALKDLTLAEMDVYWSRVKASEGHGPRGLL